MLEDIEIYTVGLGNRRVDQLIGILQDYGIRVVIDARIEFESSSGASASRDTLRQALEEEEIEYNWVGRQLGGNRMAKPGSINTALKDDLRGFADYMTSQDFLIGLRQLSGFAGKRPAAMLFTAKLPDKCHRCLIADALMMRGMSVIHILDETISRQHALSPTLRRESTELVYDMAIPSKNVH